MSKYKFLIRPKYQDFLIDKFESNFLRHFDSSQLRLTYNRDHLYFVTVPGISTRVKIKDRDAGPLLHLCHSLNPTVMLREDLKKEYPAELFQEVGTSGINFLELKLRFYLQEKNKPLKELRARQLDLLYRGILSSKTKVREHFLSKFSTLMWDHDPHTSMNYVEIYWDLITPPNIELARLKEVQEGFAATARSCTSGVFADLTGRSTLSSLLPGVQENGRYFIKLEYADGSKGELYCKEIGAKGVINRFERKFRTDSIEKHVGRRGFVSQDDLVSKIRILAGVAYDGLKRALPKERALGADEMAAYVKDLIKLYYGHHWEEAHSALATGACCIVTGRANPTNPDLNRKTLELANKLHVLIRAKPSRRQGAYVLDWDWIEAHIASQPGFSHPSVKSGTSSRKSWAEVGGEADSKDDDMPLH